MSEHMWVQESLPLFAAGGLNSADRSRIQRHVGQCRECHHSLDELNELSQELSALFAEARRPDLGETVVSRLRTVPVPVARPRQRPSARTLKIFVACACVVIVMALGGVLSETILQPEAKRQLIAKAEFTPEFIGGTNLVYDDTLSIGNSRKPKEQAETPPSLGSGSFLFSQADPKSTVVDSRDGLKVSDGDLKKLDKSQSELGDKNPLKLDALDDHLKARLTPPALPSDPNAGDVATKLTSPVQPTSPSLQQPSVPYGQGAGGFGYGIGGGPMPVPVAGPSPVSGTGLVPPGLLTSPPPLGLPAAPPSSVVTGGDSKAKVDPSASMPVPQFAPFADLSFFERKSSSEGGQSNEKGLAPGKSTNIDPKKAVTEGDDRPKDAKGEQPTTRDPKEEQPTTRPESKPTDSTPPTNAPSPAQRRIIRSGTIEFEVESFDIGVATLTKLVIDTKGAFINTVNSEKRPNGKVAGSVVVRMPPEQLDEFVFKLRRDLGKFGELKVQQISSQDITKQYTDLESQLKAARTMEERLILIIKDGKGVIKDLLLAEKELGIWRTKIEEIEGTLRYYANQASLSTLSILMVEKELRQAVDLLETERVHAGIEVEDVEKAHRAALDAVAELKGRISKTELKQQAAGQFNAVVHFEIAPEQSGPMRDRLKQLGAVARLEIDRVQTSQGGTPARDTKVKRGDSQFFVNLYNLANIAARETIQIRVAVNDVPKSYQLLRDQINKAKARVRDAQVNEQDRENVSAKIDFDAHRPDDIALLKSITEAGEVLFRQLHRRSDDANVTDAKVHIDLQIVNAASIPARETVTMRIAVADVAKAFTELRDKVAKAKARIIHSQMQEQDRLNVIGQIDLDIPRPDDGAMLDLLSGVGEVVSRNVARRSDIANVTDTKVQFNVFLVSSANIAARELITLRIAVTDVPKAFQQLREEVTKSSARIVAQVQEQDRQNVFANLDFDVLRPEHTDLIKKLSTAGEVITRHVQRQPDSPNVTDTKVFIRLELWNVDKVPARDSIFLQLAAIDVPKLFQGLRDEIIKAKAKIHTDKLNEKDRRNVHGILEFDVPKPENERLLKTLTDAGEVITRQTQRRADNESALDSKVHIRLQLVHALTIPARERVLLQIAVADVSKAYMQMRDELNKARAYVDQSSINESDRQNTSAHLEFAARKPEDARLLNLLNELGEVLSRKEEPNASGENSTDANVAFLVDFVSAGAIQPRETVTIKLETDNVIEKLDQISAEVLAVKGRIYNPKVHHMENGVIIAVVTYDVPLGSLHAIRAKLQASGKILEQNAIQDPKAPDGKFALARIQLTMATSDPIVGKNQGFRSGVSSGLNMSIRGLSVSLQFLIVGLLFVLPWVALLYLGYWLVRQLWPSSKEPSVAATPPVPATTE